MEVYNVFLRDEETNQFILEDTRFRLNDVMTDYVDGTTNRFELIHLDVAHKDYYSYVQSYLDKSIDVLIIEVYVT